MRRDPVCAPVTHSALAVAGPSPRATPDERRRNDVAGHAHLDGKRSGWRLAATAGRRAAAVSFR